MPLVPITIQEIIDERSKNPDIERMRVRRAAANPIVLPDAPKTPIDLRRKSNDPQLYDRLDADWKQWKDRAQTVINQAIMALKLDPGDTSGISRIWSAIAAIETALNTLAAVATDTGSKVKSAMQLKSAVAKAEEVLEDHEIRLNELQSMAGGGGSLTTSYYIHIQGAPRDTWVIYHNLGFKPNIIFRDTNDYAFLASIVHPGTNVAIAYMNSSVAGQATCS